MSSTSDLNDSFGALKLAPTFESWLSTGPLCPGPILGEHCFLAGLPRQWDRAGVMLAGWCPPGGAQGDNSWDVPCAGAAHLSETFGNGNVSAQWPASSARALLFASSLHLERQHRKRADLTASVLLQ